MSSLLPYTLSRKPTYTLPYAATDTDTDTTNPQPTAFNTQTVLYTRHIWGSPDVSIEAADENESLRITGCPKGQDVYIYIQGTGTSNDGVKVGLRFAVVIGNDGSGVQLNDGTIINNRVEGLVGLDTGVESHIVRVNNDDGKDITIHNTTRCVLYGPKFEDFDNAFIVYLVPPIPSSL